MKLVRVNGNGKYSSSLFESHNTSVEFNKEKYTIQFDNIAYRISQDFLIPIYSFVNVKVASNMTSLYVRPTSNRTDYEKLFCVELQKKYPKIKVVITNSSYAPVVPFLFIDLSSTDTDEAVEQIKNYINTVVDESGLKVHDNYFINLCETVSDCAYQCFPCGCLIKDIEEDDDFVYHTKIILSYSPYIIFQCVDTEQPGDELALRLVKQMLLPLEFYIEIVGYSDNTIEVTVVKQTPFYREHETISGDTEQGFDTDSLNRVIQNNFGYDKVKADVLNTLEVVNEETGVTLGEE